MKKTLLIVSLLFLGNLVSAQAEKWTNLFNGKDFSGFTQLNGQAKYEVKDGMMVGTTVYGTPNSFMATEKKYGDFILECDLLIDDSMNSGIQIRSISDPSIMNGRVHGYQVEIDPSERGWAGGIYDEARRGWLYQNERNPSAKKAFKNGEWNHYRIEAIGSTIRTWINDVPVAYLVDDMTAEGIIAFQVHAIGKKEDAGTQIKWKNIKIQTGKDMRPRPVTAETTPPVENYTLNTISEGEKALGYHLLFNGKDLSGWRSAFSTNPPPKVWTVEDGLLHVNGKGGREAQDGGDIISKEEFSAFEISFDFRLTEGANSGFKYFVNETYNSGKSAIGLEYQVLDDERHPDAKLGTEGNRTLASLYDLIPSEKVNARFKSKIGEWNRARVIVYPNNHVEHWHNGFKVLEYERGGPAYRVLVAHSKHKVWPGFGMMEKGPVLFQEHGDSVFYRNIKVRSIK